MRVGQYSFKPLSLFISFKVGVKVNLSEILRVLKKE